ncbi:MAG TPA: PEP/pyruvate-binding domain-containing protein, partial [Candidatus Deferrimicrobium sp.]|nr:PEP/pyruvate-binding domain-containing protein [Candidatus Deferrimicrobium sp.]
MPPGTRTGRATRTASSGRRATTSPGRTTRAAAPRGGSSNGAAPRRRAQKWVYLFEQGDASMRDLLGGKGAGVAEMTRAGLPVPPGFTITTQACNAFYDSGQNFPDGMWEQVLRALRDTERKTGKRFGDPVNPLLVSVRSGAKFSMPGMMDTVLNLGLNAQTRSGLAALTGDERFAKDAYRRFIQLFGKIVLGIDGDLFENELDAVKTRKRARTDADLTPAALDEVIERYRKLVRKHAGIEFPEDPMEQLRAAIGAV